MNKMSWKLFVNNLTFFAKCNKCFVALYATFAVSFMISPYLISVLPIKNLFATVSNIVISLSAVNLLYAFAFYFFAGLIIVIPVYLNGLSFSGFVLSYIYSFFTGAVIGLFSAFYYSTYSINGFFYCITAIFPAALIFSIGYLLAARESFIFSRMLGKVFLPHNNYNFHSDFKIYSVRFLVIICSVAVSALFFTISTHLVKI